MKKCSRCLLPKELDRFHFVNKSKGLLRPECKTCRKENVPARNVVRPTTFSDKQYQIFIGSILGDGHLSFPAKDSYNPHYAVTRCARDKKYLEWHAANFSDFSKTDCLKDGESFDVRTNKTYYWSRFRTRSCSIFKEQRKIWYRNHIKIVPKDLQLTPLSVAVWFCDDGCIYRSTCSFATDGFSLKHVHKLKTLLEELVKEKFKICKHEGNFIIRGGKMATQSLVKIISPHIPNSMIRKLPSHFFFISNVTSNEIGSVS